MRLLVHGCLLVSALVAAPAFAQSGESDLDDLLGEETDTPETSNRQERDALLAEDPEAQLPEEERRRRIVQTFQRKTFLKKDRYEASPHIGFITNDPFIHRYLGGASLAYHVTEVFALEISGTFSPSFGESDYKQITKQLIENNQVTPDISRIQFFGSGSAQFSPIYGKLAVGGNRIILFDMFGVFGAGVVNTKDDLVALQKENDPAALATEVQFHPTMNYGGGVRVIFSEGFAMRIEGRGLSYIEVIEGTTLEMKNNFMLLASASLFFPGMK
jgi:outer membrane beta-barrel protein